jgi:hypothetical protein
MRPGFINSFDPASVYATTSPFLGVGASFEYGEAWSGTLPDPGYPASFTGFAAPSAITPLESFEYATAWPDTREDSNYPAAFTSFTTPSDATPLESFEVADGWGV